MTSSSFDAIIIGGGHNGLVTAAYLARAGWKVLVLERRDQVGGACVTEEVWPGYKVSTLSYLCSLLHPTIIEELELKQFGFHLYPKNPSFFTAFPDGRHLFFWQDPAKTHAEMAKFSKKDADAYPRHEHALAKLGAWVESLLLTTPPNIVRRTVRDYLQFGKLGLDALKFRDGELVHLVKIMTQSVRQYLDDRYESDEIKATLATDGVIGTNGGPSTPGTAYVMLHHVMGGATGIRGLWGFVRGGMGAISDALAQSAQARGVVIRTSAAVSRILVKDGRAYGVTLDNGDEYRANTVISNVHPSLTFLKLVEAAHLPTEFHTQMTQFRSEGCSLKINLALDGLPNFTAFPGAALGPQHKATMHVCPSMDYVDQGWEEARAGRPSTHPLVECTIPTSYDDSIAPPGKHIMCMFTQYAPYTLKEGNWDSLKESFADRCIDELAQYAPNIKNIILHRQVISPLDMEREYSLVGGNIFHGDMTVDQLFTMRPVAGWAQYRTPIHGLYLCGSGAHPGGGVMGAPGYNAAREILRKSAQ